MMRCVRVRCRFCRRGARSCPCWLPISPCASILLRGSSRRWHMLDGSPGSCGRVAHLVLATGISPANDPEMASVLATANVPATESVPATENGLAYDRRSGRIGLAPLDASLRGRCPSPGVSPSCFFRGLGRSCSHPFCRISHYCVLRRLPRRSS